MPQYTQLMASAPNAYRTTAGNSLKELSGLVRKAAADFRAEGRKLQAGWKGADANAQEHLAGRIDTGMDRFASCLSEADKALTAGAAQLQTAVTALRGITKTADAVGTVILPNGVAIIGPRQDAQIEAAGPAAPAVLAAYQALAAGYTAAIESGVAVATAMDEEVSILLRGIKAQLDSALPFDSSSDHGKYFNYQGDTTDMSARGNIGNDLNRAWCELNGHTVVASELQINPSATDSKGYMVADRVTRGPDGQYHVFEVKTGAAELSDAQQGILPRLQGEGIAHPYIPDTPKSRAAGLGGGVTLDGEQGVGSVQVQRWDIDSMPDSARVALRTHSVRDVLAGNAGDDAQSALSSWMRGPSAYTLSSV